MTRRQGLIEARAIVDGYASRLRLMPPTVEPEKGAPRDGANVALRVISQQLRSLIDETQD